MSRSLRSRLYKLLDSRFYVLDSNCTGQSLIEILVAVGIGALLIVAAAAVIAPSLNIGTQSYKVQTGTALAKELMENVRVWAEGDWHNISNLATSSANHYHLNATTSPFTVASGNESVTLSTTTYTRYFYVEDVYRDVSDLIVSAGGSYDPSTKKLIVEYSWQNSATSTIAEYVTRNRNNVFWQTDWSGGPGQDGPVTSTNARFSTSTQIDHSTTTGSIIINL
ncbi:MAG: prepilin-type N-terminal cleavage/methylation domain-containing protein [Candidatus Liptonbacteria bacterium]|nr:prepilin-type N-terminal cleavage/methylation domain-containing protein [Candidatus Liptonbacteria bacterium]